MFDKIENSKSLSLIVSIVIACLLTVVGVWSYTQYQEDRIHIIEKELAEKITSISLKAETKVTNDIDEISKLETLNPVKIAVSNFDTAMDFILGFEGDQLVDNPREKSKFGITEYILNVFNERFKATLEVEDLTSKDAKAVAYAILWSPHDLDQIEDQRIATVVFDFIFHSNAQNAIRIIQTVLNDEVLRRKGDSSEYIPISGIMGPRTLERLNNVDKEYFIHYLKVARISYLKRLPTYERYAVGWRKRINAG